MNKVLLLRNICRVGLSDQRIFVPVGVGILVVLALIFEGGNNSTSRPQPVDPIQSSLDPDDDLAQFAQSTSITMHDQCETKMTRTGVNSALSSLGKTPEEFCNCIKERTVSDVEAGGNNGLLTSVAAWKALSYESWNNFWYSLVQECET